MHHDKTARTLILHRKDLTGDKFIAGQIRGFNLERVIVEHEEGLDVRTNDKFLQQILPQTMPGFELVLLQPGDSIMEAFKKPTKWAPGFEPETKMPDLSKFGEATRKQIAVVENVAAYQNEKGEIVREPVRYTDPELLDVEPLPKQFEGLVKKHTNPYPEPTKGQYNPELIEVREEWERNNVKAENLLPEPGSIEWFFSRLGEMRKFMRQDTYLAVLETIEKGAPTSRDVEHLGLEHAQRNVGRSTGKTTRLVDKFIQDFFTTGQAHVQEIIDGCPPQQTNKYVVQMFKDRLTNEHGRILQDIHTNQRVDGSVIFTNKRFKRLSATFNGTW